MIKGVVKWSGIGSGVMALLLAFGVIFSPKSFLTPLLGKSLYFDLCVLSGDATTYSHFWDNFRTGRWERGSLGTVCSWVERLTEKEFNDDRLYGPIAINVVGLLTQGDPSDVKRLFQYIEKSQLAKVPANRDIWLISWTAQGIYQMDLEESRHFEAGMRALNDPDFNKTKLNVYRIISQIYDADNGDTADKIIIYRRIFP